MSITLFAQNDADICMSHVHYIYFYPKRIPQLARFLRDLLLVTNTMQLRFTFEIKKDHLASHLLTD
jgi:hypothetical protein